jgi:predicted O-methyltransferase YrrM
VTAAPIAGGLDRPPVRTVLDRLHGAAAGDTWRFVRKAPAIAFGLLRGQGLDGVLTGDMMRDLYISLSPAAGGLLYLTARALGARRVVEFGTSFGISTIYLAAAVQENGGGSVIGTELEPTKHRAATANLAEAGLADVADVRLGDARETLRDVPAPLDLVLLDGWKDLYLPVLQLLTPKLRTGAVVFADNINMFRKALAPYVAHVQSGRHGFRSVTLPIGSGLEYSLYEGGATPA